MSDIGETVKLIPLTGKHGIGRFAIVDKLDYDRLTSRFTWHADRKGYPSSSRYAGCYHGKSRTKTVYLHREVFGDFVWHDKYQVDHRNGNKLDNRRSNLRIATATQNRANKPFQKNNTSGFKGVFSIGGGRFKAMVGAGKDRIIGKFATAEEAAKAYDREAIRRWGEFAHTNFPLSKYNVTA